MPFTATQILESVLNAEGLTRTLGPIEPVAGADGLPVMHAGNSAVVFRVRTPLGERMLKCYTRRRERLALIYGERFRPRELFVHTPGGGAWCDAVVDEWLEGETLRRAVDEAAAARDTERLAALAGAFDRLAAPLLAGDCAHGDLKPENILCLADGSLRLVDYDAAFRPALRGLRADECGTAAYNHPSRTAECFDERIDDFGAALVSSALHALALDPGLHRPDDDGLLFDPVRLARGCDPMLGRVTGLFARRGLAAPYRIARTLAAPHYALPQLVPLFEALVRPPEPTAEPPEADVEGGLWGFRLGRRFTIAPLYDEAFDFSEGLAAVRLGGTWHFIDLSGRIRLSLPGLKSVKPFRGGTARGRTPDGRTVTIPRPGI